MKIIIAMVLICVAISESMAAQTEEESYISKMFERYYYDLVFIEGNDLETVVNYSGLAKHKHIQKIKIYECKYSEDNDSVCDNSTLLETIETSSSTSIQKLSLKKAKYAGKLVRVDLIEGRCVVCSISGSVLAWSQLVFFVEDIPTDLEENIIAKGPLFSFHENERFFPVYINDIYDRPMSEFEADDQQQLVRRPYFDFTTYKDKKGKDYMSSNGDSRHKFTLSKSVARDLNQGGIEKFPVYYFAERIDDYNYWVTYFVIYTYDIKFPEYLFELDGWAASVAASSGDHAVDRESVSVHFKKTANSWNPYRVIYAGHLHDQQTRTCIHLLFSNDCTSPIEFVWDGGRVGSFIGVDFEAYGSEVARISELSLGSVSTLLSENFTGIVSVVENRPVVFVAHGSHAMTPFHTDYELSVTFPFSVREPAGRRISFLDPYEGISKPYEYIKFDNANPDQLSFTFSGSTVKGVGAWYRSPPFIRQSIADWAESSENINVSHLCGGEWEFCEDMGIGIRIGNDHGFYQ